MYDALNGEGGEQAMAAFYTHLYRDDGHTRAVSMEQKYEIQVPQLTAWHGADVTIAYYTLREQRQVVQTGGDSAARLGQAAVRWTTLLGLDVGDPYGWVLHTLQKTYPHRPWNPTAPFTIADMDFITFETGSRPLTPTASPIRRVSWDCHHLRRFHRYRPADNRDGRSSNVFRPGPSPRRHREGRTGAVRTTAGLSPLTSLVAVLLTRTATIRPRPTG